MGSLPGLWGVPSSAVNFLCQPQVGDQQGNQDGLMYMSCTCVLYYVLVNLVANGLVCRLQAEVNFIYGFSRSNL